MLESYRTAPAQVDAPTNRRPAIAFIATRVPYPPVTGHYIRTFNILRGLAEHYDVHLLAFQARDADAAAVERARRALGEFCASVHIYPVRSEVSRLWLLLDLLRATLQLKPFVAAKYDSPLMRSTLRRLMKEESIALVHADSLPSGEYLRDLDCPVLLTNHNVEYMRLFRFAGQHRLMPVRWALELQAILTRRYEKQLIRTIGTCITVSNDDAEVLARDIPQASFHVVPNGADTSAPALDPAKPWLPTALWVGGMDDPYNRQAVIHFAENIFPHIVRSIPDFRWTVVGKHPPAQLLALAQASPRNVQLAGFVDDLRKQYAACSIVVVPLISGAGTKLKVLEAMAMGRAVVTTSVGAEGIGARDGVELEITDSDEEFARRVVRLLQDPDRSNAIARAARDLAERVYDWRVVNDKMISVVKSLIR